LIELKSHPVKGHFDFQHLQEINRRIYQDVYPWAGQARQNFDAVKEEYIVGPRHHFTPPRRLRSKLQKSLVSLHNRINLEGFRVKSFLWVPRDCMES